MGGDSRDFGPISARPSGHPSRERYPIVFARGESIRVFRYAGAALVALALAVGGCARWNALRDQVRGPGYTDDTANWSKNLRQPANSGPNQVFGVDQRAREIESNLGYR
jgi:hypothetical protein